MAETVHCVKLKQDLPAIDENTPEGARALKMARMFGGPELEQKVKENVSQQAWNAWPEHMLLVMNEFRLDPASPESNQILAQHMERFFFSEQAEVPGYVPPDQK